jgi:rare lipoprotein A
VADRVIDLSRGAARVLGFEQTGTARVHVRYLGPAPRLVAAGDQPAPIASVQSPPMGPAVLTPPVALASAPQQAAAADGAFVVQVGAYSDLANAQRVRAAVADVGPANVDERQGARGTLYRVRVGPFANAADAEAARARAAQLGYGESVVAVR